MTEKYFCAHTKAELDLALGYCQNCERFDCAVTLEQLEELVA